MTNTDISDLILQADMNLATFRIVLEAVEDEAALLRKHGGKALLENALEKAFDTTLPAMRNILGQYGDLADNLKAIV